MAYNKGDKEGARPDVIDKVTGFIENIDCKKYKNEIEELKEMIL